MRSVWIFTAGALLGLSIGLGVWYGHKHNGLSLGVGQIREGGYKFINPLLECDLGEAISSQSPLPTVKRLIEKTVAEERARDDVTELSLYLRDLNNGPWVGINLGREFYPASLYKVPLLITYLELRDKRPNLFKEKIVVSKREEVDPSYYTNHSKLPPLELNRTYSVEELLERLIIDSDNTAAFILATHITNEELTSIYKNLTLDNPEKKGGSAPMTARNYATFFRVLYNSSYIDKDASEYALSLLSKTNFDAGLVAGVPKDVVVSHKFGIRSIPSIDGTTLVQLHDCGIVYKSNHPYLICIMTQGKSVETLTNVIARISKTIYDNYK